MGFSLFCVFKVNVFKLLYFVCLRWMILNVFVFEMNGFLASSFCVLEVNGFFLFYVWDGFVLATLFCVWDDCVLDTYFKCLMWMCFGFFILCVWGEWVLVIDVFVPRIFGSISVIWWSCLLLCLHMMKTLASLGSILDTYSGSGLADSRSSHPMNLGSWRRYIAVRGSYNCAIWSGRPAH